MIRFTRCAALIVAVLSMSGCLRLIELFPADGGSIIDDGGSDAGVVTSWGTYAASLPVGPCPSGTVLTVNTAMDEVITNALLTDVSMTGPTLSFREAIFIAYNSSGPTSIVFDATVFPVEQPATISFLENALFPMQRVDNVCIDARNRGVIMRWPSTTISPISIWNLGTGSLQIGLTLFELPFEQTVYQAQVAGCRYGTDGVNVFGSQRFWQVELLDQAILGPGNVLVGMSPVRTLGGTSRIEGNSFGFDPTTQHTLPTANGVDIDTSVEVIDNLFVTTFTGVTTRGFLSSGGGTISGNRTRPGADVSRAGALADLSGGTWTVGPGNTVTSLGYAVTVGAGATVLITQNAFNTDAGISVTGGPPAPSISALQSGGVLEGICAMPGTIELFEGLGARYVGSATCAATSWSSTVGTPPTGTVFTATLSTSAKKTSAFSSPFVVP